MRVQGAELQWFLGLLVNLGLPALVWATVTTGLILIVRGKTEETPQRLRGPKAEGICLICSGGEKNPTSEALDEADQAMYLPPIHCVR